MEGLANERAGFVSAQLGCLREAQDYFNRAVDLYKYKWGCISKAEWVEEMSQDLLAGKAVAVDPIQGSDRFILGDVIEVNKSTCAE